MAFHLYQPYICCIILVQKLINLPWIKLSIYETICDFMS